MLTATSATTVPPRNPGPSDHSPAVGDPDLHRSTATASAVHGCTGPVTESAYNDGFFV